MVFAQTVAPNTSTTSSLYQNPEASRWPDDSFSPMLLVSLQFHLRKLFDDFGVALSEELM